MSRLGRWIRTGLAARQVTRTKSCRSIAPEALKHGVSSPPLYHRALVVFAGRAGVWWLRWLKPGFRHCFAAVDDGTAWLTVDPLLHRLEVRASGFPSGFDLAGEYRRMNLVVLEIRPPHVALRCAPLGIFTCVETVKRLLGLRAPWVFTPWQLYRFLAPECELRVPAWRTRRQPVI